jgi:hypothetical protein
MNIYIPQVEAQVTPDAEIGGLEAEVVGGQLARHRQAGVHFTNVFARNLQTKPNLVKFRFVCKYDHFRGLNYFQCHIIVHNTRVKCITVVFWVKI